MVGRGRRRGLPEAAGADRRGRARRRAASACRASGAARRRPAGARRRDRRPGRARRRRAHGAGADALRPDARRRGRRCGCGGERVTIDSPARAVALGLAYVPEDRRRHGVILEMSVAANTTLAALRARRPARVPRRAARARARARASSSASRSRRRRSTRRSRTLSGGNQQKVALARWLATRPRVLILDEPTQGVDVGAKAEIHRLIVELAEQGLAILLISSELPEILGMSDRIARDARGARSSARSIAPTATPERSCAGARPLRADRRCAGASSRTAAGRA